MASHPQLMCKSFLNRIKDIKPTSSTQEVIKSGMIDELTKCVNPAIVSKNILTLTLDSESNEGAKFLSDPKISYRLVNKKGNDELRRIEKLRAWDDDFKVSATLSHILKLTTKTDKK